ncbi:MAG: AAA family ATPase [Pseudomonadota bacterium]
MTQAGGPAAINGFLYQILHHLGWIAEVSLSGTLDGIEMHEASLILEPRTGGDARAEANGVYLVEQYKTRNNGTWAIADVISVLRDLRNAVPGSHPVNACYRFVTDGRPGLLEAFNAFLVDVKSASGPGKLDQVEKKAFSRDLSLTSHEFFNHIVSATRAAGESPAQNEQATVFHLLRYFDLAFGCSGDAHAARVEQMLRRYAPDLGDERGIRERLVGMLVETLSRGEAKLTAAEIDTMLRKAGLNTERMHRLAILAETLGTRTRHRLARLRYRPERDVRQPPEWPQGKPVLLIAGPSGAGKTWQLGRLLESLSPSRTITTLLLACQTREAALADIARDLWQTGLNETSEKSLVAISHFLRELVSDPAARQITVAIDDIQDVDLARALVRQDWREWDVRLVLTVPLAVARALEVTDRDTVHVHSLGDFTIDELEQLLQHSGRKWLELPPDLKKLLRNPILAGLFLELPYSSAKRAPRSEYEIFEAYWNRIAAKGRPGDRGIVIGLAASFINGQPHPLPRPRWHEVGLDDDSLDRLEATGWLRAGEDGAISFAHDRLLNWAAATYLLQQHQHGQITPEGIASFLSGAGNDHDQSIRRRLNYVTMDTLWLLAEDARNAGMISSMVARMEDSREFGSYGEELYTHLLPTLGQRAVPILLECLSAAIAGERGNYRIGLIGRAFATLAQQDHVDLRNTIGLLLRAPSGARQRVALTALAVAPDPTYLDLLWEIHQRYIDALEDKTGDTRHEDYRASFSALRACVAQDPEWLRNRIFSADLAREHVSALGYLLNSLEHADAPAIWKATAHILMAKVPASKPRSLLYCIARFADRERLDFVIQHLSRTEDFANGAALYTLSVLDPRAAIDRLMEVGEDERYLTRNQWLPGLLRAESELTRQRLLALAELEPQGRRNLETLFAERPDELNEAMLRFVLRTLERNLRQHLEKAPDGDPNWLFHPLRFLVAITRPDLLAILEAEAGGELERMLTVVACSRLRTNSNRHDHIREDARQLLIRIGGNGITTLIERELESEHYWVRHGGLNCAFVRNDHGIVERLAEIARRPLPRDANGRPESEPYSEFHQAMSALAALGADSALVDVLGNNEVAELPPDLSELRAHGGAMAKTLTQKAAETLVNDTADDRELKVALGIAWVSGDNELVPLVRAVLRRVHPTSKVAAYACIALWKLDDQSEEFAQLAYRLSSTRENAHWGINGLAGLGDRGADLLLQWLQEPGAASRADHEGFVIRLLYERPATRSHSVAAAVASCRRGRHLTDAPYDIAAEADDPAMREQIVDKAFASRSFVVTEPLRAIEGLARYDAIRAAEAIEVALHSHPGIERELCRMLVQLAREAAAPKLVRVAMTVERGSLLSAVGRVLRRLDPKVVSPPIIDGMKGSASERKTAATLAGWLPLAELADVLGNLADHDSDSEVRHAALLAFERHRQETAVRALLEVFHGATYERKWSLLAAILNAADPYLLTDRDDPLWLGNVLSDELPAVFEWHARKVLQQRKDR